MSYNKLVRDKIPDIIKDNGEEPIFMVLPIDEYKIELEKNFKNYSHMVFNNNGKSIRFAFLGIFLK